MRILVHVEAERKFFDGFLGNYEAHEGEKYNVR